MRPSETVRKVRDDDIGRWCAAGLPVVVAEWVSGFKTTGKDGQYVSRADRFASYSSQSFDCAENLAKAWKTIAVTSLSDNDLLTLFMVLPDKPLYQPFPAIYGARTIDPGEERRRYDLHLGHVLALQELIKGHQFDFLMRDATATPEAHVAAMRFREVDAQFGECLRRLNALLEVVDPTAKIPTEHWASEDADRKNYVIQIASLNRYLKKPQHSALATIAKANCPDVKITAEQIRKAYARGADKRA